jgi:hypothetical protein
MAYSTKKAQFTLRGDTCHVQIGSHASYDKFDVPATAAVRDYFNAMRESGSTRDSFAGSHTQYAPVEVREKVSRVVVIPARTITVPETVLGSED